MKAFQFRNGSINSPGGIVDRDRIVEFQFRNGSINSIGRSFGVVRPVHFNSAMVRLTDLSNFDQFA